MTLEESIRMSSANRVLRYNKLPALSGILGSSLRWGRAVRPFYFLPATLFSLAI